jgi:biopolymer transport protein ExbD
MSASFGQEGGSGSQDFDINLAPIIDCLTVLIAFMLASASFLSIGILDAGVAASGATSTDNATPPPVNIAIELGTDHNFIVKVSGKSTSTTPIAKKGTDWNYDELVHTLKNLKAQWPTVNAVTLSAENTVEYQNVVKSMEVVRQTMPVVLLGGF